MHVFKIQVRNLCARRLFSLDSLPTRSDRSGVAAIASLVYVLYYSSAPLEAMPENPRGGPAEISAQHQLELKSETTLQCSIGRHLGRFRCATGPETRPSASQPDCPAQP
jgi:hypothetical protein